MVRVCKIETKVKDLIVQDWTSAEFESEVQGFLLAKQAFSTSSAASVASAEKNLVTRQGAYQRAARTIAAVMGVVDDSGDADAILTDQLMTLRHQVTVAEGELKAARKHAESGQRAFERLVSVIHGTRNVAAAWERVRDLDRRVILDYLVHAIYIAVEPFDGMKRANRKTAVVVLRSDSFAPRHFELPQAYRVRRSTAARNELTTAGSDSTKSLDSSAAVEAVAPSSPSAQAACDRTSASSSDRASTREPASDVVPTLPSATAALRFSPTRFARFIGEPLNADENSACDMDSRCVARDRASCPSRAGLAANAASESSCENLRLYGHTSWEMCRYNRFEISLTTGRGTLGLAERLRQEDRLG